MKKTIAIIIILVLSLGLLAACGDNDERDGLYIAVLSKGFQHQFWQAVDAGAQAAGEHYGVEVFFDGPESEADVHVQVDMFNQQMALNPDGIALAALSTQAVLTQLADAYSKGIPVVGFDSGVPEAPAGQIRATASTNNMNAAALGADHMFPVIRGAIEAATEADPVVIVILSQDVTSESITGRTRGFAEQMHRLAGGVNGSVAITGGYGAINTGDAGAAVRIEVVVGATSSSVDMATAASGALTLPGLIGFFCSNEGAANGVISAINAGSVVPAGVPIVGFDAGEAQKAAVRSGLFMGGITQDPFQIGYQAVSLVVRAIRGESIGDVDTGAQWWDPTNMDRPDIALLLYD